VTKAAKTGRLHRLAQDDRAWAIALPALVGFALLAAWQGLADLSGLPEVILPAPTAIMREFLPALGTLGAHARATGLESLFAFLLSTVLGLCAAILLSTSRLVRDAFYPNMVLFQLIPKIALAPLFVFWMGVGAPSRLTYSVFISFFPVALATMEGLSRTDPATLRLCRAVGASRWQTFFSVRVPYSLPYFFSGMKVAATMSVIGIVVGEFISAREGLGFYILMSQSRGETAHIFVAIAALCAIGLGIYAVTAWAEHLLRLWWRGGTAKASG
jgi:NitT/TauT family transport system permease protein